MVTPTTASPLSNVSATGDDRIDALLKGPKWGGPAGTGFDVTYSFPQFPESIYSTSSSGGYGPKTESGEPWDPDARGLNAPQQQYFSEAVDAWSEVANIAAVEVPDNASVVGDIRVAFSGKVGDQGVAAWTYYPYEGPIGGDVWLDPFNGDFNNPAPDNIGFYYFLHEIGHALGLSHSFNGGKSVLPDAENTHQYTVMSYTSHSGVSKFAHTPMLYDMLAVQHLYGANTSTRDGDTTYVFDATGESFKTIWDGGGVDTLDASAQTLPVDISLAAGSYSSIGPKAFGGAAFENVAIAFGVTIENATGGSGDDTIIGNAANNGLNGSGGNDAIDGLGGNDSLLGGGGDDTLKGGFGFDTLDGGDGTDTADLSHSDSGATIDLEAGQAAFGGGVETLISIENVIGTDGNNFINGTGGANRLEGGGGDDTLKGGFGFDTLDGGDGTDTADLSHSDSGATIDLEAGQAAFGGGVETLIGIENAIGTDGDNVMIGTGVANKLEGGGGDDTLKGGYGLDTLDGGEGTDTADLSHSASEATIDLEAGQAAFGGGVETLIGIENAIGTDGDNVMIGTGVANKLEGGGGNDTLNGGFGFDTLDGGEGTDTADFSHTSASADIDLATGQVVFGGGVETLISIENVIGTGGENLIIGTGVANRLEGGGGNDTLNGGFGFDTLDGGAGTDTADFSHTSASADIDLATGQVVIAGGVETLISIENAIGTDGDNFMIGNAGANTLAGGGGNDSLEGNGGADRFLFQGAAFGQDVISDFVVASDKIAFEDVGGADDPDDLTYEVRDFDGDATDDGIRITFADLGGDLADARIDVLNVSNINALKADILFV